MGESQLLPFSCSHLALWKLFSFFSLNELFRKRLCGVSENYLIKLGEEIREEFFKVQRGVVELNYKIAKVLAAAQQVRVVKSSSEHRSALTCLYRNSSFHSFPLTTDFWMNFLESFINEKEEEKISYKAQRFYVLAYWWMKRKMRRDVGSSGK